MSAQWEPPTDEERAMLRRFAYGFYVNDKEWTEFVHWYLFECQHIGVTRICESLAMDGLP